MRTSRIIAGLAALGVLTVAAPPAAAAPPDDVDSQIIQRLSETATPGAAWAVIDGDEVVHTGDHGTDGNGEPVDADTVFLWGSLAKPITATAILRLEESGLVNTAAPVSEYLPDFAPRWNGETVRPTVEQLLTHTSGLAAGFGSGTTDRADPRDDAVSAVAAELNNVELAAAPGERFQYASTDYLLLGAIIEAVTGETYAEYVTAEIFQPLGMDGAFASQEEGTQLPPGHRPAFGFPVAFGLPIDNAGAPYGYLGGDLDDLARFAIAHLNSGGDVLSEESAARAHDAHTDSDAGHYGYGWTLSDIPGSTEPMVWHSGAAPGYQAVLVMLPQRDQAIVLTQNTYGLARDAQLLNAANAAAATLIDETPGPEYQADPVYTFAPWGLAVLALLLLACGIPWRRRPARRRLAPIVAWWTLAIVVSSGLLVVYPYALDTPFSYIWLWAPDLAWTAIAVSVAALAAATVRTVRISRAAPTS